MTRIALPQRGQPLDVSYVIDIINAVNDLYTNTNRSTYSSIDSSMDNSQPATVKTSNAKIVTGKIKVDSVVSAGSTVVFTFAGSNFKYPPIVTATPISDTPASTLGASVVIKSVSTSSVTLFVSGTPTTYTGSITLSVIAIGEAV